MARQSRRRHRPPSPAPRSPCRSWAVLLLAWCGACGPGGPSPFPLQDAASQNVREWVDQFIAAGHDPTMADDRGFTPLHVTWSARMGSKLIGLGAAVDAVADDGTTPLHAAVLFERPVLAKMYVSEGADVDAADESGWRPLHYAAASNDPRNLRMLLRAGADPSATTPDGERAIDIARRFQNYRTAAALER